MPVADAQYLSSWVILKARGAVYGKAVEIVEWGGEGLLRPGVSGRVSRGVSWGVRSGLACGERTARPVRMVMAPRSMACGTKRRPSARRGRCAAVGFAYATPDAPGDRRREVLSAG